MATTKWKSRERRKKRKIDSRNRDPIEVFPAQGNSVPRTTGEKPENLPFVCYTFFLHQYTEMILSWIEKWAALCVTVCVYICLCVCVCLCDLGRSRTSSTEVNETYWSPSIKLELILALLPFVSWLLFFFSFVRFCRLQRRAINIFRSIILSIFPPIFFFHFFFFLFAQAVENFQHGKMLRKICQARFFMFSQGFDGFAALNCYCCFWWGVKWTILTSHIHSNITPTLKI